MKLAKRIPGTVAVALDVSAIEDQMDVRKRNFVELGRMLIEAQKFKLFVSHGYRSFFEFVENEFGLKKSEANKMMKVIRVYEERLGVDEVRMLAVGVDKLLLIIPMISKMKWEEIDAFLDHAASTPLSVLQEELKDWKAKQAKKATSMRDVFVQQFLLKMKELYQCNSTKNLHFHLALYFQDMDLDMVKALTQVKREIYEEQILLSETGYEDEETTTNNTNFHEIDKNLATDFTDSTDPRDCDE